MGLAWKTIPESFFAPTFNFLLVSLCSLRTLREVVFWFNNRAGTALLRKECITFYVSGFMWLQNIWVKGFVSRGVRRGRREVKDFFICKIKIFFWFPCVLCGLCERQCFGLIIAPGAALLRKECIMFYVLGFMELQHQRLFLSRGSRRHGEVKTFILVTSKNVFWFPCVLCDRQGSGLLFISIVIGFSQGQSSS